MVVPPIESVDKFAGEQHVLSVREERLTEEVSALGRKQRVVERKLVELGRGGEVPSVHTLAEARAARRDAWARLRQVWDERASVEDSAVSWAERIIAFEAALARADDAADRLMREADRVAGAAALNLEREEIERLIADADVQRADLGRRREAAQIWWNLQWSALGVDPGGAEDMRGWLRRFGEACDVARRLENVTADAHKLGEQVRRARQEVGAVLRGAVPFDTGADLVTLCEQAAALAQRIEGEATRRAALEREIAALAEERTRAARECDEADAASASWRMTWAEAIAPLGLPPAATTVEAEAVLELAAALAHKREEVGEINRRLQGIDRDATQFEEAVVALVTTLTPDLSGKPSEAAAEIILQRHRDGIPARQARVEMEADLQRRGRALCTAQGARAAADEKLSALVRAAGAVDLPALEHAERRSTEALELRQQLRESEDQIVDLADGLSLDAALREIPGATTVAPEDLDDRIDRLREEMETLDRDTQRASQSIGSVGAGLRHWEDPDGGADAADASDDAQAHLARIRALAAEYARLRLAARLLSAEVERYREQHQGPVLSRASTLLARLTLNRYTGLRADFDDSDRPVLRCVRADGTKVPVDGLSDGTRDQLYLALRLATLERQAASGEPLPLILDDILIHFDDERAGAALAVLAEHARGTQVVLFTHHARIVDLAERLIPAQALRVSRLE
jgi:hypothetical protein